MNIGLFFGSFNPIHTGHLVIASQVIETSDLKQVWFVVSPQNPLKQKETLLSQYDRLHLVKLAIEDDIRFKASNVEFSLPKPSYTIDTLTFLSEKYPKHSFSLIIGGDNMESIDKWKNHEALLKYYHFYVYLRPGYDLADKWKGNRNVTVCEFPLLDISASYIRHSAQEGISLRYLVPDRVREYIETYHLFRKKSS